MDTGTLELHDALIESTSIDYAGKRVSLVLALYERAADSSRTRIELSFEEVESVSHVADFNRLEQNRSAGNINYWVPGDAHSPSFIYLVDGVMTIRSSKPPQALKLA
jgi:hypothetical protein